MLGSAGLLSEYVMYVQLCTIIYLYYKYKRGE